MGRGKCCVKIKSFLKISNLLMKLNKKFIIIIPARLASTRLPNKPLANILGKTMIRRVYEQALKAGIGEVYVACDGKEIAAEIESFGGKAIITNPDLHSGTDRVFAALKDIDKLNEFEVIINLQGDLPAVDPEVIRSAASALIESNADIATVASIIKEKNEILDPNVVKAVISFDRTKDLGNALYFSRSAIPYNADKYYHHIGIYAYKKSALEKFISLSPSKLEKTESLEQLRALENSMKIAVRIVDSYPLSVDTKEDLEEIKRVINNS